MGIFAPALTDWNNAEVFLGVRRILVLISVDVTTCDSGTEAAPVGFGEL
jgi:hypothetical protein